MAHLVLIIEMQDFVPPQDPNNVGTQIPGSVQLTATGKIAMTSSVNKKITI